jgi:hypothetical protein
MSDFEDFDTDESDDDLPEEIQEWLDTRNRILEDCEDVPERAENFAISVSEKIESMAEWIEENKRITPNMIAAIENMDEALQRARGN